MIPFEFSTVLPWTQWACRVCGVIDAGVWKASSRRLPRRWRGAEVEEFAQKPGCRSIFKRILRTEESQSDCRVGFYRSSQLRHGLDRLKLCSCRRDAARWRWWTDQPAWKLQLRLPSGGRAESTPDPTCRVWACSDLFYGDTFHKWSITTCVLTYWQRGRLKICSSDIGTSLSL